MSVLVAFAACAFPDFEFEDETNNSTEAAQGGGPTTTASAGGAGACTLGEIGSCGTGDKCTVDPATGKIGCSMAGSREQWDLCSTDADCIDGTWCDLRFEVCKPFCENVDDCNFGATQGECVPLTDASGTALPGSGKHCTSGCEPISAAPCLTPLVTCVLVEQLFDCAKSGGTPAYQDCTSDTECAPGMVCGENLCSPWCTPPGNQGENTDCGHGWNWCVATNPQVHWEEIEYGFCW